MNQTRPVPLRQKETPHVAYTHVLTLKPPYQPPRMVVYGTVTQLIKGSGGDYDDECTSGKWPGSDE